MAECKIPTKPMRVPSTAVSESQKAASAAAALERGPIAGGSGSAANKAAAAAAAAADAADPVLVQEYSLRVPKTNVKPISIMRFNGALGVDPSKWTSVKMGREDNSRLHKPTTFTTPDEEMPKFGAGSEYGREAREEARRRKYGLNRKKYNPDDQPWVLKLGDKINRKYKGVREGGVSENASYFIFTQAPDGAFEVFPVQQWYNFTPIQRYKSLTSEEAEQEFGRRNKIMNYFSVMVRKRMKNEDDGDDQVDKPKGRNKGGKKNADSDLKVSEMDDWVESDEDELSEDEDEDEDAKKKKKAAKSKAGKKGKKKKDEDDEGLEDSDDGDEEGRELDYISDTSETESEGEKEKKGDIQGVDQEQALRHLLESGSDSEEEGEKKKEEKEENEDGEEEGEGKKDGDGPSAAGESNKKKKKKKKKKGEKKEGGGGGSGSGGKGDAENLSDDEDDGKMDDVEGEGGLGKMLDAVEGKEGGNSRDGTPSDVDGPSTSSSNKRKASHDLSSLTGHSSKKPKVEVSSTLLQSAAGEGITEEAVRRYLLRKPMTVTELLHKFKSKKTKISSQDMVNVIAHILKKINPLKRVQNQKMYLSLSNK